MSIDSPGPMFATAVVKRFGALSGRARGAVDLLGLLALVDFALDDALADAHLEAVDGRVVGQRERVHGLGPFGAGVVEALRDGHARDHACDRHSHVGRERRGRLVSVSRLEQQRAGADVFRELGGARELRFDREVKEHANAREPESFCEALERFSRARRQRRQSTDHRCLSQVNP
jgi:hypothetical protein